MIFHQRCSWLRPSKVFFVLAALAFAAAPRAEIVILEEILAKINGDILTRSEYESAIEEVRAGIRAVKDLTNEERAERFKLVGKDTLRNLIDEKLLVQKGTDLDVDIESMVREQQNRIMKQYKLKTTEEFQDFAADKFGLPFEDLMDQMRRNIMTQTVLNQEVGPTIQISPEEIAAYYEEHKSEFVRKDSVQLSEIFISTADKTGEELEEAEKKAKEVHDRVHRGEPFAEMAKRFSESEQTAEQGGYLGVYEKGMLRKDMEDIVFAARSGFITELIEIPNGYMLLKVDQRFQPGQAALDEVKDEVRQKVMTPRWNPAVRTYLVTLREEAYIEIRPGYVDTGAASGQNTDWSDPAKLAPVTTTKEELLLTRKSHRLLWMIPFPGGGGDKTDKDVQSVIDVSK